jgi:hypothetical protein
MEDALQRIGRLKRLVMGLGVLAALQSQLASADSLLTKAPGCTWGIPSSESDKSEEAI